MSNQIEFDNTVSEIERLVGKYGKPALNSVETTIYITGQVDEIPKILGVKKEVEPKKLLDILLCNENIKNPKTIIYLLKKEANPNIQNEKGYTILHRAAMEGNEAIIDTLLKNGANLSIKDKRGLTPFFHAISNGHLKVGELLLENGANINDKQYWYDGGRTLLHMTTINDDNSKITEFLLINNACPNAKSVRMFGAETPLHEAVHFENLKIAKLLLQYGADPTIKNYNGNTPFDLAKDIKIKAILFEPLFASTLPYKLHRVKFDESKQKQLDLVKQLISKL
ncbi:MAG: ankyrin repeat domain-containing protein [Sphingobacteriia bacterium]|nr:ankyrin repeat domain-containing protein [Sphingobacteriia bacterium]